MPPGEIATVCGLELRNIYTQLMDQPKIAGGISLVDDEQLRLVHAQSLRMMSNGTASYR